MTLDQAVVALQQALWLRGEQLLMHHTNPWELDEALVAWGYGMGPCEAQDLIGLEAVLGRQRERPIPILPRMVAEGRMGKIGGVGYYRYPGGGGAVIDPLIEDLILEEAWFAKVARVERSDGFLVAQMNDALRGGAAKLHAQGCGADVLAEALVSGVQHPREKLAVVTG